MTYFFFLARITEFHLTTEKHRRAGHTNRTRRTPATEERLRSGSSSNSNLDLGRINQLPWSASWLLWVKGNLAWWWWWLVGCWWWELFRFGLGVSESLKLSEESKRRVSKHYFFFPHVKHLQYIFFPPAMYSCFVPSFLVFTKSSSSRFSYFLLPSLLHLLTPSPPSLSPPLFTTQP